MSPGTCLEISERGQPCPYKPVFSLADKAVRAPLDPPFNASSEFGNPSLNSCFSKVRNRRDAGSTASFRSRRQGHDQRFRPAKGCCGFAIAVAALIFNFTPLLIAAENPLPSENFRTDILPILTKAGCNAGACHGAAIGQAGFKLSLLGYDPELDFERITREFGGRRMDQDAPAESLLLKKATRQTGHEGGRRIEAGSDEYDALVAWITNGASYGRPDLHSVEIEISPNNALISQPGESIQLSVVARFSDGTIRDVTKQALFSSNDDGVAEVDEHGKVTVVERGLTSIMVRHLGHVDSVRIGAPFQNELPDYADVVPANFIDEAVVAELKRLRIPQSPLNDDAAFFRRVYLDVIGTLPKPEEVRAFLNEPDGSRKRAATIDALLRRPEFVDFWTLKLADLLLIDAKRLGETPAAVYYHWLKDQVAKNTPYNQIVRDLLVAQGNVDQNGPANFHRLKQDPRDMGEFVSQAFLGLQIACARCHNHPFDRWSQDDYYHFAAYFARSRVEGGNVVEKDFGEVRHPKSNRELMPRPLGSGVNQELSNDANWREALADWITGSDNSLLARATVNRVWKELMGVGIIEPVYDIRPSNPPSNPELLQKLTDHFIASNYDLRDLIRAIVSSNAYQLSSSTTGVNERDTRFFSHAYLKPVRAQVLADAIAQATGVPETYPGYPSGTRAVQIIAPQTESYTLDVFGRCPRESIVVADDQFGGGLAQVLHLMNSEMLNEKVQIGTANLLPGTSSPEQWIDEFYLRTLSRFPTSQELNFWDHLYQGAPDKTAFAEDLLWTLLNSREFAFNH